MSPRSKSNTMNPFTQIRLFVLGVLLASSAAPLMAAPQIQFEKEAQDFGKIKRGVPITASYPFKNVGDADLEILNVSSSCGCTSASAKQKKLAPGESSVIEAVFDSTNFSGPISKSVYVTTNDPARGTLALGLTAEVVSVATFQPPVVNIGSVKVNGTVTQTLTIVPNDPKTFQIAKVEVQGTHVTVPRHKKVTTKTGTVWEVTVNVNGGAVVGRVMEGITVRSKDGGVLTAQVFGNVVP